MSESATRTLPDFWGFFQDAIARLDEESRRVQSDADMESLLDRWLREGDGVLASIESGPIFGAARPRARQVFTNTMRNRVRQVEREWQEIWRSLHED
jgi:hypothetical protein